MRRTSYHPRELAELVSVEQDALLGWIRDGHIRETPEGRVPITEFVVAKALAAGHSPDYARGCRDQALSLSRRKTRRDLTDLLKGDA